MLVPNRNYSSPEYRFGFGSQEKVDELKGAGSHYTAMFWEYDPRIGRRWNLDPVVVPWESGYATFRNNPIALNDPYGDCPDCPDPETIGSKSEKTAQGIINRHGGARGIGKDLGSGDFSLTDEETNLLYTKNDDGDITGFSAIGSQVQNIIQDQAYLEKFNADAAGVFSGLANSGDLTNAELTDLQSARADVVSQTKGQYMMAIFSPENVGTILFMSLGTGGNVSATLRQKGYQFMTTRLQQFAVAEAKAMTALSSKGVTGFTNHGASRAAIERGFSNQSILKIVKSGDVIKQTGKYGTQQLKYTLGNNSVVVEQAGRNAGKIVTTFSNQTVNGVKGGFVPF